MNVTAENYVELAMRTKADQQKILDRLVKLGPKAMQLINALIGGANDLGELAEPVKRWIEYGKDDALDAVNMKEEVGDELWRLAQICDAMGFTMQEAMEANIRKLQVRYGDKYTDFKATNRDLESERVALENQPMVDPGRTDTIPESRDYKVSRLITGEAFDALQGLGFIDGAGNLQDFNGHVIIKAVELIEQTGQGWSEPAEVKPVELGEIQSDIPTIRAKPLNHSYTRYCLRCKIQPIHSTNELGICTDCFMKHGEPNKLEETVRGLGCSKVV